MEQTIIKTKGDKCYKCIMCTGIFEIEAMDNCTELNYCPNCGARNINCETNDIFDKES